MDEKWMKCGGEPLRRGWRLGTLARGPTAPTAAHQHPDEPVGAPNDQASSSGQPAELLTDGHVLEHEVASRAQGSKNWPRGSREEAEHRAGENPGPGRIARGSARDEPSHGSETPGGWALLREGHEWVAPMRFSFRVGALTSSWEWNESHGAPLADSRRAAGHFNG